jgi:hypothetical protein
MQDGCHATDSLTDSLWAHSKRCHIRTPAASRTTNHSRGSAHSKRQARSLQLCTLQRRHGLSMHGRLHAYVRHAGPPAGATTTVGGMPLLDVHAHR